MASKSEHHSAARQFYAEAEPSRSARELCEEGDDPEALAMEEWAEEMVKRGMPRQQALQAAAAIWGLQRAKAAACAGSAVVWAGEVPERAELLEMLSRIAREIALAPKPKMTAAALLLAMGDLVVARSARQLAERCKLSHELVADRVVEWQRMLGLPRTSGQKSEEAIDSYRATNGAQAKFKHDNEN